MYPFEKFSEEFLVLPAYLLWKELFGKENKEEEEMEDENIEEEHS